MPPTSSGPLRATRVDPQGHRGAGRLWTFPPSVAVLRPWRYSLSYRGLISREQATEVSQWKPPPTPFPPPIALLAEALEVCFPPCLLMNYKLPGNQVPHLQGYHFPQQQDDPHGPQAIEPVGTQADNDPSERQTLGTGFPPPECYRNVQLDCNSGSGSRLPPG